MITIRNCVILIPILTKGVKRYERACPSAGSGYRNSLESSCNICRTAKRGKEKPTNDEKLERIEVTGKYTVSQTLDSATGLGLTLRETPQSVSILTDERMFDQNIDTVLEAVNNAVGVSASEMDNVRNTFMPVVLRLIITKLMVFLRHGVSLEMLAKQ